MSAGREARRRAERAMRASGVAAVARTTIPPRLVTTETIAAGVEHVLELLVVERGDITGHLAITVGGDHPNFPGVTVVEGKAARLVEAAEADHG